MNRSARGIWCKSPSSPSCYLACCGCSARHLEPAPPRGSRLGRGLGLAVLGLFLLIQVVIASLDLTELGTALDYLLAAVLVGMLIIFQPELRRGLMMLGRTKVWQGAGRGRHDLADPLAKA